MQVDKLEESFDIINSGAKPLAAYIFTNDKKLKEHFVNNVSAGGMVVNDTTVHVSLQKFPMATHHLLIVLILRHHSVSLFSVSLCLC